MLCGRREAGEVEVDRRHRHPPVDDRVEVRAGDADPGRGRAADPVVGNAAGVEALGELILVDAAADAGEPVTERKGLRRPRISVDQGLREDTAGNKEVRREAWEKEKALAQAKVLGTPLGPRA